MSTILDIIERGSSGDGALGAILSGQSFAEVVSAGNVGTPLLAKGGSMRTQEEGDPYHYNVLRGETVTFRVKAIGTSHLVSVVLDNVRPPPPPVAITRPPWVEYRFDATKPITRIHFLNVRYSFANDAAPGARYVHEIELSNPTRTCVYTNIPDVIIDDPMHSNVFEFAVVFPPSPEC